MVRPRSAPGSPRSKLAAMLPASTWLLPTAAMDCRSSVEKFAGPLLAGACTAVSGMRTCAVIWRIWASRLLTSIVLMPRCPCRWVEDGIPSRDGFAGDECRSRATRRRRVATRVSGGQTVRLQTVLAQLLHQRGALHAQQARGVRHHAAGGVERLADQPHLDVGEVILEIDAVFRQQALRLVHRMHAAHGRRR